MITIFAQKIPKILDAFQKSDIEYNSFSFFVNSSRNGDGERIIVILELLINDRTVAARQMQDFFGLSTIRIKSKNQDFSFKSNGFYDNKQGRSFNTYGTKHFDSLTFVVINRKLLPTGKYTLYLDDYFRVVQENSFQPFSGNIHISAEVRPDSPQGNFQMKKMDDGSLFLVANGANFAPTKVNVEISVPQLDATYIYKENVQLADDGIASDLYPNDGYYSARVEPLNCGK